MQATADELDRRVPERLTGSGAAVLSVAGLTVEYANGMRAVRSASITVAPGQRVAIVGESGSGKSTLAMAVAGFLRTNDVGSVTGTIEFQGTTLTPAQDHLVPFRTPGISMVFQDAMTSLDPVWTVGSQLCAVIRANEKVSRAASRTRAENWLRRVGLADTARVLRARPYELSGGMRQRVMMALALSGNPRLLIADEPTSALDASLARATMDLLVELAGESGVSLLIISHDIHLCLEYADELVVMYRGEIVEQGPTQRLATQALHPYTQGLLHCVPTLDNAEDEVLPTLQSFMAGTTPVPTRPHDEAAR